MYTLPLHGGHPGLYGRHSRSLGIVTPPTAVQPKLPLTQAQAMAQQNASVADGAALAAENAPGAPVMIPVMQLQQALVAHFGIESMRHSCGAGTCDGRWGAGTERMLDRVFDLLGLSHSEATYEVKGRSVLLPGPVATWVLVRSGSYLPTPNRDRDPEAPQDILPPEEPYESPYRVRGPNVWLIVGGVTAALGVGALGFVVWKKRGRR
ncbi:MAG: hypothetical protein IPK85_01200 [Gemmatimonadetes bacterium]|nr:hypothetical protein [Gemmatimonadota bacterium]